MGTNFIWALIGAMGIPTAVTAFCFWLIKRKITKIDEQNTKEREKRQKVIDEKDQKRNEIQFLMVQGVNASIALSEATAKAVERIPDAHCNGDMHAALEYASTVKRRQREALMKQGLKDIYDYEGE